MDFAKQNEQRANHPFDRKIVRHTNRLTSRLTKQGMDTVLASAAILALSPIFGGIAMMVLTKMGRPVLFKQERPGLNGKPFYMYKFRSMTNERDGNGELLPPDQRLTRFGQFLRSTSLDELPELFNVLKGEMSLVGPRPLLMDYLDLYTPEEARRHKAKPGITGWAQVNGRNTITWENKFALDVWYVDNRSLRLDIKILWMTVVKVLKRENLNTEGFVGMPKFTGSAPHAAGFRKEDYKHDGKSA